MQDTAINFRQAKDAYVELYGKFYNELEFDNFEDAFEDAWKSFDYISGASDEYELAQGMCNCWQLQQS